MVQSVDLCLIAILYYVAEEKDARDIIDRLMRPLVPGSALALSTTTADSAPDEVTAGVAAYGARGIMVKARDKAEVEHLFDGLELVDPGVALVNHWHPDEAAGTVDDAHVHMLGGVARKA